MTKRARSTRRTRASTRPGRSRRQSPASRKRRVSLPLSRSQREWVAAVALWACGGGLMWALVVGHSEALVTWVRLALGWGCYILPLLLVGAGVHLALRALGRPTRLPWVRVGVAGGLLAVALALAFILAGGPATQRGVMSAGGTVGRWVARALVRGLGRGGAVVVLLALGIVGIKVALGLPIARLMVWVRWAWMGLRRFFSRLRLLPSEGERWATANLPTKERRRTAAERSAPAQMAAPRAPATPEPVPDAGSISPTGTTRVDAFPSVAPAHRTWDLPVLDRILVAGSDAEADVADLRHRARIIEETMYSLGVPASVVEVNPGPTVTQFGLEPGYVERRDRQGKAMRARVRVSQIERLSNDLALALAAPTIRIVAPVPGRSVVGVEVPNREPALVGLRGVMESNEFREQSSPLAVALGRDVSGDPVVADLSDLPHLLIAGATGAGKSVCINALIACLLCRNTPDTLRLLMIDPKRVELSGYDGVPHLVAPVIVDAGRVLGVLQWLLREMDRRYDVLADSGVRDIGRYNVAARSHGEPVLPYVVCFIDELADLMMISSEDVERALCRLAQMARATGIHLVVATQRPSVDVLTGLIKANFPARLAFAVSSQVDSRVILDCPGAERLLGRGDALLLVPDAAQPRRIQGCWVGDDELARVVTHWRAQAAGSVTTPPGLLLDTSAMVQQPLWPDLVAAADDDADPLLEQAIALVRDQGRASASMLQRNLLIGYSRAARLIDTLEEMGVVGPAQDGGKPRVVLPPAERRGPGGEGGGHEAGE